MAQISHGFDQSSAFGTPVEERGSMREDVKLIVRSIVAAGAAVAVVICVYLFEVG